MKQRILITGGSGLFAINCARALRNHFYIYLLQNKNIIKVPAAKTIQFNFSENDKLSKILSEINPYAVIHAAGLTNVNFCEINPNAAFQANSNVAGIVAKACAKINCKIVYLSTDHIFDLVTPNATEETKPNPINIYARSKLEGERQIKKYCEQSLIIRTNFFGWGTSYRYSFSDFLFQNLSKNNKVNLYDNITYTPILLDELVVGIIRLLNCNKTGTYHIVGDESLSKFDFGKQLASIFGFDSSLINAVKYSDKKNNVPRPRNMSLDNSKYKEFTGEKVGSVTDFLNGLRSQQVLGYNEEYNLL